MKKYRYKRIIIECNSKQEQFEQILESFPQLLDKITMDDIKIELNNYL